MLLAAIIYTFLSGYSKKNLKDETRFRRGAWKHSKILGDEELVES